MSSGLILSAFVVLMHLQVRGASCLERSGHLARGVFVLMHLQVRGASCREEIPMATCTPVMS